MHTSPSLQHVFLFFHQIMERRVEHFIPTSHEPRMVGLPFVELYSSTETLRVLLVL